MFYNFFCSPGGFAPPGNLGVVAWDVVRMTTSSDGLTWSKPSIVLQPSQPYDRSSVCDPSIVKFRGSYFLYHTCINTCTEGEKRPPDGYFQNRICAAVSDKVGGPWRKLGTPVIQDLSCDANVTTTTCAKEVGAYCVGQPTAAVIDGEVVLFYSSVGGINDNKEGPNPGRILAMSSNDGRTFSPRAKQGSIPVLMQTATKAVHSNPPPVSATLFTQRDVDIRYDRDSKQHLMVQGDVGSTTVSWSLSSDGGRNWLPYDANHRIATHDVSYPGGANHNPGAVPMLFFLFSQILINVVSHHFCYP